jgi:hypothetical protein
MIEKALKKELKNEQKILQIKMKSINSIKRCEQSEQKFSKYGAGMRASQ